MKFWKSFVLFLLLIPTQIFAADRITTTVTFTNNPVDLDTFVFNASTRTFKTNVSSPAIQITIGANLQTTATNSYLQIAANPFGGGVIVSQTATNIIQLLAAPGQTVSASLTGTWGYLTYSTQAVTSANAIRVPFSAEPTASVRTNNASQLIADLNTYSTNKLSSTATATANLVNIDQTQTINGSTKTFNGSLLILTNGTMELYLSNIDIFTNSILRLREGAYMQFDTNVWILDQYGNTNWAFSAIDATNKIATLIDITNRISTLKSSSNTWSGVQNFSEATGTLTNATTRGTFTHTSDISFTRVNNTTLANGNNAGIDFGSETVYVKIKPGPTAAFTINGITGGRNGRVLHLANATSQALTIANESGVDPTPANRITTNTGSDVAGILNAYLIYDSETSRWILEMVNPTAAASLANPTGTIGLSAVNGTAITGMRSDGAPALSQSISPTWTGTHTFGSNVIMGTWTDSLTADNQVVTPQANLVILSSNDAVAVNRTFLLAAPAGITAGHSCLVTIIWSGTNAGELADDSTTGGHSVRLSSTWLPTQNDSLTLFYDASASNDWIEVGRSTN